MRTLAVMCACAIALGACGGGSTGGAPSEAATATAARAVATLAAPIATTLPATTPAGPLTTSGALAAASAASTATATTAPAATVAASVAAPAAPATTPTTPAPSVAAATPPPPTPAATAAAAGGGTTVKVTLTETAIKLDRTAAPAGAVTFAIVNAGVIPHELIVLQTSIPQDQLPLSTTDPKMVQTPGQVGVASNIAAGASATLTLTLGAGPYDLICNIESHYKDGMHTGFAVTAAN
jgi:uncharacterized cupredoxin-like copper-binding protein